jgi:hypothetical protein
MNSRLLNDFELSLENFLSSVTTDMDNKKSDDYYSLLNIWNDHNTNITSKVVELTFILIEKHDVNQNLLKDSDRKLQTEILIICTNKAKKMVDEMFNNIIKPIIYEAVNRDSV